MITANLKKIGVYLAKQPFKLVDKIADRAAAVAGAVGLAQFPAFLNSYTQRLGGHVDEARINVAGWQHIADKTTGGNLADLISIYQNTDHQAVIEAGNKAAADVARFQGLEHALKDLLNANAFERAYTFLKHVDTDIAYNTLKHYTPNIPTDAEGLVYAGVGLLLGMLCYRGIKKGIELTYKNITKKKQVQADEACNNT